MLLRNYILHNFFKYAAVISIILLFVFCGVQLSEVMRKFANGNIPQDLLGKAFLLQIPFLLSLLLPLVLLLSGVLVIYNMLENGEMTVIQASGIGLVRLNVWTIFLSLVISAIVAFDSLYLEAFASKMQNDIFSSSNKDLAISSFQAGKFYPLMSGNAVIFVAKAARDASEFKEIFISQHNKKTQSWDIVTAEKASKSEKQKHTWVLHNAREYSFVPGNKEGHVIEADDFFISFPDVEEKQLEKISFEELTLPKLWNLSSNPVAAALLVWRISLPLSALVLVFFIVPLSFSRFFGNQFMRITAVVTLYAFYIACCLICRYYVATAKISVAIGSLLVPTLFIVLISCYYMIIPLQNIWRRLCK